MGRMVTRASVGFALGLAFGFGLLFIGVPTAQAVSMFPPCPQVGDSNGCDVILTINPSGTVSVTTTGQPAYEGVEDSLVGVVNNFGSSVPALGLSGTNIFGFDGDGICSPTSGWTVSAPYGNSQVTGCTTKGLAGTDPDDYQGPNTTFSNNNANSGTVNFTGGLSSGGTAYFSLEENPTTVGSLKGSVVPEPTTVALLGPAVLGLMVYRPVFRNRKSRTGKGLPKAQG